jgi:hypothetical protein
MNPQSAHIASAADALRGVLRHRRQPRAGGLFQAPKAFAGSLRNLLKLSLPSAGCGFAGRVFGHQHHHAEQQQIRQRKSQKQMPAHAHGRAFEFFSQTLQHVLGQPFPVSSHPLSPFELL